MKLDFKKAFKAAKMPALALIAVTVLKFVLVAVGIGVPVIILLPIQFAILAYAGYNGVKAFKLDLANGALAGATASFLSMIFTVLVSFAQYFSGVLVPPALSAQTSMSSGTIMIFLLAGSLGMLIFSPVIGIVFGAIGAYIAQKK
ncbi:MAG: hypothetical protein WC861_02350 [Candidatus Micrarchaeia archaeon]|jgi:hypothetical protein